MRLRAERDGKTDVLTHAEYLGLRYFDGLNGVRAIAVVAVVWHHSIRPAFTPILDRGHMGVDLFFVLSGFLISTLLIRERAATGRIALGSFWARRFLRLFPAYYALLAAMALLYVLFKPSDPDARLYLSNVWVYAAYLSNGIDPHVHNLGHTWTLATEEQFYLLWPLIEAIGRPLIIAGAWIAAFVANQAMNFGLFDGALRDAGAMEAARSEIVQVTYSPILLGVGLAHLLHRPAGYRAMAALVAWRGAALVFAAVFLVILAIGLPTLDGLPRLVLHLLIVLFFAAILIRPASGTTRLLEAKSLRCLGTISYGMYLYHMILLSLTIELIGGAAPWAVFPVGLAMTVAVAAVSYRYFEQPFLALGRRFRPAPIVREPDAVEAEVAR